MAITRTLLGESASEGTGLTTTTVSLAPTANHLITMAVLSWVGSAGQNDLPTVSGNGLTWVQVNTITFDSNRGRLTVFRAMGASPSTGTATITFPTNSQDGVVYQVADYAGTDTTGTNGSGAVVQSVTSSTAGATSNSATLAALRNSSSFGAAASCHVANEAETPGGGATNLVRDWFSTPVSLSLMWEDNANITAPSASWTTSAAAAMIALEIGAPTGGFSNTVPPSLSGSLNTGSTLTINTGTWSPTPGSFTYTWDRADDTAGTNMQRISTATGATYTLAAGDASKYIRAGVYPAP